MSPNRLTKKQLKEDTFISTTVRVWEYVREHQNMVFIGLIVIVVIIAGALWVSSARRQTREAAANQLADALTHYRSGNFKTAEEFFKLVTNRHKNMREGVYATYFIGKCALEDGRNLEAIDALNSYLAQSNRYPFFHDAAMAGKATALENERRYEEAAEVYLELAENLKTNDFYKKEYLERAAVNLKQSNQKDRAIEVMEKLLELTTGLEHRDLEIEIEIMKG